MHVLTREKLGICTAALFFTFVTDLVAVRLGKEYLAKHGISTEHQVQVAHGLQTLDSQPQAQPQPQPQARAGAGDVERAAASSGAGAGAGGSTTSVASVAGDAPGLTPMPSMLSIETTTDTKSKKPDYWSDQSENTPPGAQILGVAILEFGILFHSVRPWSRSPSGIGSLRKLDMADLSLGHYRNDARPSLARRIYHSLHRHHLSP